MDKISSYFHIDGVVTTTIGDVSLSVIVGAIQALAWFIEKALSLILGIGFPLSLLTDIFKVFGINFVNITDTVLLPYEHYFIFFCTPEFNLPTSEQVANSTEEWLEWYWPKEVKVEQSDLNNMATELGLNATHF